MEIEKENLQFYFRNDNGVITNSGVDFGGPLRIIESSGSFQLWKKPSRRAWVSRSEWATDPSRYYIAAIKDDGFGRFPQHACLICSIIAGRKWRTALIVIKNRLSELSTTNM